nr:uncharacterized protein LOC114925262 [Arachis hypogaea]
MQPPFVLLILHKATNTSPLLSSLRTIEATAAPNHAATTARRHNIPPPQHPAATTATGLTTASPTTSLSSLSSPSLCSPVSCPLSSSLLAFHLAAARLPPRRRLVPLTHVGQGFMPKPIV